MRIGALCTQVRASRSAMAPSSRRWGVQGSPVSTLFFALATAFAGGYRIDVQAHQVSDGEVQFAYHLGPERDYLVQTATLTDGSVVFTGDETLEPGVYVLAFPLDKAYIEILIGTDQTLSVELDKPSEVDSVKIQGSVVNTAFYEMLRYIADRSAVVRDLQTRLEAAEPGSEAARTHQQALEAAEQEVQAYRERLIAEHPGTVLATILSATRKLQIPDTVQGDEARFEWYRSHFWDGVDFGAVALLRTKFFEEKLHTYLDKLTYQEPEALKEATSDLLQRASAHPEVYRYVATTLTNKYAKSRVVCQDSVYVHLVDEVYASGRATWADAEMVSKMISRTDELRPTLCGTRVPELALPDASGERRRLAAVEAPWTILYFYDPECSHCRRVGPKLGKLSETLDGVGLYTVSNDDRTDWKAALEAWGVATGTHVAVTSEQDRKAYGRYGIRGLPAVFLLDADKKVVLKQIDVDQIPSALEQLRKR